jgi:hypothetical protein
MIISYLGWIAFALNVVGIASYLSFGGPANTARNRTQRIISQLGLLTLLVGLGLQLASLFVRP